MQVQLDGSPQAWVRCIPRTHAGLGAEPHNPSRRLVTSAVLSACRTLKESLWRLREADLPAQSLSNRALPTLHRPVAHMIDHSLAVRNTLVTHRTDGIDSSGLEWIAVIVGTYEMLF